MKTSLLDADPDLRHQFPPDSLRALGVPLQADLCDLEPGPWQPPLVEPEPGHLGYLVLDGMLLRAITVDQSRGVEVIFRGDLIRPWVEDPISFCEADWHVVESARLAVLDRSVATRLSSRPELTVALLDKHMARIRSLAISLATETVRGVDRRLLVLFWHLAERWGRRVGDTAVLSMRLTHETLSALVGARRPSVTTALRSLSDAGALTRSEEGDWVLHGAPPPPNPHD